METTETVLHAELEAEHCKAELYVNGMPIAELRQPPIWFQSVPAHEYLVPGLNQIELLVEPGPTPSSARVERRETPPRAARAAARLVRYAPGVYPDVTNGTLLASLEWRADADERQEVLPKSRATSIDLGQLHGRWCWQDAPFLALNSACMEEALSVFHEVASAISHADTRAFWTITEPRIREAIRAYPALTEAQVRADLTKFLAFYQKAISPVLPARAERHDFRLVAEGRVLQLIDDDWLPSLWLGNPEDGSPVPYPLFLAKINGRLQVVR